VHLNETQKIRIGFGILNFMKVMLYLQNLIPMFAEACYFPFSTNIQFTLILLLLLILDNDIYQNPGPEDYEFSVFHLNAKSKLDICRKGKVTGFCKHGDQIL
jgi:hypothetical protein